jgi:uncharacterized protein YktB (UPF0637 family)
MMESHSLRHFGIGMFATVLFLLFSLMRLGRFRGTQRRKRSELAQQRKSGTIQLATEDDVSVMLKVGKRHMEEERRDPNDEQVVDSKKKSTEDTTETCIMAHDLV